MPGTGDDLLKTLPAPPRTDDGRDAGARLDRFIVLGRLGAGGMGLVLSGWDPRLERKVAIKLLRPDAVASGAAIEEARARLLREAQAMARLNHDNVISVYEVGTAGADVFVAMEFVDGGTLTDWLSAPRDRAAILGRFLRAGRGLAAAHAAGLVHRDFKPDNVLVGRDGRVRVTDFGLVSTTGASVPDLPIADAAPARSISGVLTASLTHTGALLGTPMYMAPEQHRGVGADARADQFAFCVALWEALYGKPPFAGVTYLELATNVIGGQLAPPPAAAAVPAWLHAILVRGLRPDPADRWPSMDALLAALADDPAIRRRRRTRIAALCAAIAVLGTVAAWGLLRGGRDAGAQCRIDPDRLAGTWDADLDARVAATFAATGRPYAPRTARAVGRQLDAWAGRWLAARRDACEATHVHGEQSEQLLDRRMRCLDKKATEMRVLVQRMIAGPDATLLDGAIDAVAGRGDVDECGNLQALDAASWDPAGLSAAIDDIRARLDQAATASIAGRWAEAAELARGEHRRALALDYAPLIAESSVILAEAEASLGHAAEAARALEQGLTAAARGRDDWSMVRVWARLLIAIGIADGRPADALLLEQAARAALLRAGDPPEMRGLLYNSLGAVLAAGGRPREALDVLREVVALREADPEQQLALAQAYDNLAVVLIDLVEVDEAARLQQKVLAIRGHELGTDHPDYAAALNNLGATRQLMGQADEAERLHRQALAIREAALGPDHALVAYSVDNLGASLLEQGKPDQALPPIERGLAIRLRQLGATHPDTALSEEHLGQALNALGRRADARAAFQRALDARLKALGPDHPAVADSLMRLGHIDRADGRLDDAQQKYERALAIREAALGPDHADVGLILSGLANLMNQRDRYAEAAELHKRATAIVERRLGPDHLRTAEALLNLGAAVTNLGRCPEARGYQQRALAIFDRELGPGHPHAAFALMGIASCPMNAGRWAEALPSLEDLLGRLQKAGGPPGLLGWTRFALARGLRATRGDRARARALATAARADYQAAGDAAQAHAIAAWLRAPGD